MRITGRRWGTLRLLLGVPRRDGTGEDKETGREYVA